MRKIESIPMKLVMTIAQRGHGNKITSLYIKNNAIIHMQFEGVGTATSEVMDMFGLATSEKDIILSMVQEPVAAELFDLISESSDISSGIVMSMPLSAVNNMIAAVSDIKRVKSKEGEQIDMGFTKQNTLILVLVNQGYTEDVMATAKTHGATGGTVIRARWTGSESVENFYGLAIQEEKELLAILVPNEIRNKLMDEINREHGLKSEAQAIVCSVPVDKAAKLS